MAIKTLFLTIFIYVCCLSSVVKGFTIKLTAFIGIELKFNVIGIPFVIIVRTNKLETYLAILNGKNKKRVLYKGAEAFTGH